MFAEDGVEIETRMAESSCRYSSLSESSSSLFICSRGKIVNCGDEEGGGGGGAGGAASVLVEVKFLDSRDASLAV